jgi:hypothetical protein
MRFCFSEKTHCGLEMVTAGSRPARENHAVFEAWPKLGASRAAHSRAGQQAAPQFEGFEVLQAVGHDTGGGTTLKG